MYNMIKTELRMENKKVYFPCYGGCEFNSLEEAVNHVEKMPGRLSTYISEIVMYNIRFRDCLRTQGIDGVIEMMIDEAPIIVFDMKALNYLKEKWAIKMKKHIANYDIQCLPKDYWIRIDNCWFEGLDDIDAQVVMYGNPHHDSGKWNSKDGFKGNAAGLYIGNIWESYPKFDSFDDSDNRCFENYIFSKQPLTEERMEEYCAKISLSENVCMVHENIPDDLLPILYYNGDSDYVLLATAKGPECMDYLQI